MSAAVVSEARSPSPVLYPLFLKLAGREVLVVGAGEVAARKVDDLVAAGARVTVVATDACERIRARSAAGKVVWLGRRFRETDTAGAWLVVAATDDAGVQRAVSAAGEARRVHVIAVDDLPNGTAYSAAVVRRGPVTVAISSSGEAPALTRLLREILEQVLPEEAWIDAARALREKWRADGTPMGSRFGELVRAFKARGG